MLLEQFTLEEPSGNDGVWNNTIVISEMYLIAASCGLSIFRMASSHNKSFRWEVFCRDLQTAPRFDKTSKYLEGGMDDNNIVHIWQMKIPQCDKQSEACSWEDPFGGEVGICRDSVSNFLPGNPVHLMLNRRSWWQARGGPLFTMKELEEATSYMRNKEAPFTGGIPVSLRPTVRHIQNMTKGGKKFPCAWKVATLA